MGGCGFHCDFHLTLAYLSKPPYQDFFGGCFCYVGLLPQPRILRWVPRRSTCRTRKGCQGGQASHLHSAPSSVFQISYLPISKALRSFATSAPLRFKFFPIGQAAPRLLRFSITNPKVCWHGWSALKTETEDRRYAGCCWEMQWRVPPSWTRSRQSMGIISRVGNCSAMMPRARLSFFRWRKVGTRTAWLRMRKFT